MAQVRDKQTSELIAECDPVEAALLAVALGQDQVLFDSVGVYDQRDVLARHKAALKAAQDAGDESEVARARACELRADNLSSSAADAMTTARDKVRKRDVKGARR